MFWICKNTAKGTAILTQSDVNQSLWLYQCSTQLSTHCYILSDFVHWTLYCRFDTVCCKIPNPQPPYSNLSKSLLYLYIQLSQYTMRSLFAWGLVISNSWSAHPVWLKIHQWYRNYRTDKHSVKFWTITGTLTMNTVNPTVSQNTTSVMWITYHQPLRVRSPSFWFPEQKYRWLAQTWFWMLST